MCFFVALHTLEITKLIENAVAIIYQVVARHLPKEAMAVLLRYCASHVPLVAKYALLRFTSPKRLASLRSASLVRQNCARSLAPRLRPKGLASRRKKASSAFSRSNASHIPIGAPHVFAAER